jgi:hypothetical protein
MGEFSFQYPLWFIGLCLLTAIISGLLMYYKSTLLSDKSFGQKLLLACLRVTSIFFILLLLLNPFYKYYKQTIKKPILVVAQDVSSSIAQTNPTSLNEFLTSRKQMSDELAEKFDVIHLEFSNKTERSTRDSFKGVQTNLSSVFDFCVNQLDFSNVKGLILATDGIYNAGKNPLYHSAITQLPVYPILFGDTIPESDLTISSIFFNDIIYAGDKFAIQADIQSWNLQNEQFDIHLKQFENDQLKTLQSESIKISSNKFFQTKEYIVQTDKPGIYRYRLECSKIAGERNIKNNIREFYIEVLDAKKQVLLVHYAPHPDITAIKESLLTNKNYEDIKSVADLFTNLEKYSLAILHQLPGSSNTGSQIIQQLNALEVPILYIVGSQTEINSFNKVQDIVQISGSSKSPNEALPVYRETFSQFTLSDESKHSITRFPPINAVYGSYSLDPSASVFFFQKIGKVETNYPLWICAEKNGIRKSIILGEGIWKWKLHEYMYSNSFESFNEIINKTVQFTSTKEDRRKFRVYQNKRIFDEGESIMFQAEFYNDNFERINIPDANLTIYGKGNLSYNYSFSKSQNYYSLDAGSLSPGDYSYKASLHWDRKDHHSEGKFSIQILDIENNNRVADFGLLLNVADKSGGKVYHKNELSQLSNDLLNLNTAKSIISQSLEIKPLIDQKWVFFIIFLCLASEWFLRRYWGSY